MNQFKLLYVFLVLLCFIFFINPIFNFLTLRLLLCCFYFIYIYRSIVIPFDKFSVSLYLSVAYISLNSFMSNTYDSFMLLTMVLNGLICYLIIYSLARKASVAQITVVIRNFVTISVFISLVLFLIKYLVYFDFTYDFSYIALFSYIAITSTSSMSFPLSIIVGIISSWRVFVIVLVLNLMKIQIRASLKNFLLLTIFLFVIILFLNYGLKSGQLDITSGRVFLWSAAWSMFVDEPIFGVGFGGFSSAYYDLVGFTTTVDIFGYSSEAPGLSKDQVHPHNILFGTLSELGLVGLTLLISNYYYLIRRVSNVKSVKVRQMSYYALVSLVIFSMFSSVGSYSSIQYWVVIAIVQSLIVASRKVDF